MDPLELETLLGRLRALTSIDCPYHVDSEAYGVINEAADYLEWMAGKLSVKAEPYVVQHDKDGFPLLYKSLSRLDGSGCIQNNECR